MCLIRPELVIQNTTCYSEHDLKKGQFCTLFSGKLNISVGIGIMDQSVVKIVSLILGQNLPSELQTTISQPSIQMVTLFKRPLFRASM